MTNSPFSFSEAASRAILWKKVFLKVLWFAKFLRTLILQNTSGRLRLHFPCNFTKMGNCQQCFEKIEALTWELPFRYIISFSAAYKRSVYASIGLHCLLPEAAPRVELCCKKCVLKNFVNFMKKHLCFLWSSRPDIYFEKYIPTTAFALHSHHSPLINSFNLYSAPSSSSSLLLSLISPVFVFGSNSKGFKEF